MEMESLKLIMGRKLRSENTILRQENGTNQRSTETTGH
jgi:hypothetical protein